MVQLVRRVCKLVAALIIAAMRRLQGSALDSLPESILFPLAIKALHPVLNLVYRLLFAVKSLESDQIERVAKQIAFN